MAIVWILNTYGAHSKAEKQGKDANLLLMTLIYSSIVNAGDAGDILFLLNLPNCAKSQQSTPEKCWHVKCSRDRLDRLRIPEHVIGVVFGLDLLKLR